MDRLIANQIEFLRELNREERAKAQTREAARLANQQQEADRREQYKRDVRRTIESMLS